MRSHKRDTDGTQSESRDVRDFFGKTKKKPEADDKPRRVPADRNTGSKIANKLKGKIIG